MATATARFIAPTATERVQFAKSMWKQVNSDGYIPDSYQYSMGCITRLRRNLTHLGMKLIRSKTASERRKFGTYYVINAETGARVRPLSVLKIAGPPFLVRTAAELMAGRFYSYNWSNGRMTLHKDGKKRVVSQEQIAKEQAPNYKWNERPQGAPVLA